MLKLCATPIGNMEDITLRVLNALKEADAVWCEDTRHTLQLLNHFDIKKPLVSCHAHNEQERCKELVEELRLGKEIVYVSDAGMPGISDPGAVLVRTCREQGLPYTVLPGASAVLMSAVLSGLPCDDFSFFGFLPRSGRIRRELIEKIGRCGHLAILYESPHRVGETFEDLYKALGDLPAALCRELTKKFETADTGTLASLAEKYREEEPKGECVILVLCSEQQKEEPLAEDITALLARLMEEGLSVKDAAKEAASRTKRNKKECYRMALAMKEDIREED